MSFKIEEDQVYIKYNSIWNKITELLDIKFHSEPIYDNSYIKTKVKHLVISLKHCLVEMKSQKKE